MLAWSILSTNSTQKEKLLTSYINHIKKSKRNVQGVPQLEAAGLPRHQEEPDKTKQAEIEQT